MGTEVRVISCGSKVDGGKTNALILARTGLIWGAQYGPASQEVGGKVAS